MYVTKKAQFHHVQSNQGLHKNPKRKKKMGNESIHWSVKSELSFSLKNWFVSNRRQCERFFASLSFLASSSKPFCFCICSLNSLLSLPSHLLVALCPFCASVLLQHLQLGPISNDLSFYPTEQPLAPLCAADYVAFSLLDLSFLVLDDSQYFGFGFATWLFLQVGFPFDALAQWF